MDHLFYFFLVLLCFHARLFIKALWSPAGKGLTYWLSFVMSDFEVVTFPLVLSVVFAEYAELIRLFEMECLIKVAIRQYCLLWCSGLGAGLVAYGR